MLKYKGQRTEDAVGAEQKAGAAQGVRGMLVCTVSETTQPTISTPMGNTKLI